MTEPRRLTDERLAWLAAKPCYEQRVRSHDRPRSWLVPLILIGVGVRGSAAQHRRRIADIMADYRICVDNVVRKLTPAERAALRSTDVLPWFLPEVEQRHAALKAQRKA